jgi:hypothetical protein
MESSEQSLLDCSFEPNMWKSAKSERARATEIGPTNFVKKVGGNQ